MRVHDDPALTESREPSQAGEQSDPFPSVHANDNAVHKLFNMTGTELDPPLTSVLERGPKFAISLIVTKKTLSDVEVGMERAMYALRWKMEIDQKRASMPLQGSVHHQLKPRFADNDASVPRLAAVETERAMAKLKHKVLGFYRNQRNHRPNILPEEEQAITKLAHNKSVIVKPSDKCKGLVVMKKDCYVNKAMDILNSYEQVKTNPTPRVEASTKRVIKTVLENKVHKSLIQSLLPQGSRTAEFYGLPKNHKETVPLRPIVSACGGPLDKITWFLDQILSQLVRYVPAHLPNTDTYLHRLRQRYPNGFPPGTIVFSLDVTNLYGSIPIDEAVQTVINLLQEHRESVNLYGLSWRDVEPLLSHCLTNSYLRFGQSFYKQKMGLPMGSRIAPSVAIIFMGALEDIFLSSNRAQPEMYMRYIDDCLCVWSHGSEALTSYFEYVNKFIPLSNSLLTAQTMPTPRGRSHFWTRLLVCIQMATFRHSYTSNR